MKAETCGFAFGKEMILDFIEYYKIKCHFEKYCNMFNDLQRY